MFSNKIYIGYTLDLEERLKTHNAGSSVHTSMYKPWKLIVSFEFNNKNCAIDFEKYLKSGSGRAFIKKRFLHYEKN